MPRLLALALAALLGACAAPLATPPEAPPAALPATTTTTPAPLPPPTPEPPAAASCAPTLLQPEQGTPIYLVARVAGCEGLVAVHQGDQGRLFLVSRRMLETGGLPAGAIDSLPAREVR